MKRNLLGVLIFVLAIIISYNLVLEFDFCNTMAVCCH
jgi:hypothetical protein